MRSFLHDCWPVIAAFALATLCTVCFGADQKPLVINPTTGKTEQLQSSNTLNAWTIPSGATANRTFAAQFGQTVNILNFGGDSSGVADNSTAFAAAQASIPGGGAIFFPHGTYLFTSPITASINGLSIVGDGMAGTRFKHAIVAGGPLVTFQRGGGQEQFLCSIKDIGFFSDNVTTQKTFLRVVDNSEFIAENLSSLSAFTGATSIGIQVRGRDSSTYRNLNLVCDKPISIEDNPNHAIDCDQTVFENSYLIASGNPCVTIDSGVNVSHLLFTGYQAWVGGTQGLLWVDSATATTAYNVVLENVRCEQMTNASAFSYDVQHNYNMTSLVLRNCSADPTQKGIRLRKINRVLLDTFLYSGTGEAINADGTIDSLDIVSSFFQDAGTATLTGLTEKFRAYKYNAAGPVASTVLYGNNTTPANFSLLNVVGSTASTSPTTGALVVTGGVGIGGGFYTGGSSTVGDTTATHYLSIDGSNSGASGGAAIAVKNGGSNVLNLGNKSSLLGTAYDATAFVASPNGNLEIARSSTTHITLSNGLTTFSQPVSSADTITITTAGKGLSIKEGSNARMGVATLVGGTVTVNTTAVTASSRIFLTCQVLGTVAVASGYAVTARSAATSFTITASDPTDTSQIAWMIVEPAP